MTTMIDVSTLTVVECCDCSVHFAMPVGMHNRLRHSHETFFCPAGHRQHFDLERAAFKGQVTKLRNKLARGECPCCSMVFGNVREHIKFKHPEFSLTDVEESLPSA
jgi:hypothetical protein